MRYLGATRDTSWAAPTANSAPKAVPATASAPACAATSFSSDRPGSPSALSVAYSRLCSLVDVIHAQADHQDCDAKAIMTIARRGP